MFSHSLAVSFILFDWKESKENSMMPNCCSIPSSSSHLTNYRNAKNKQKRRRKKTTLKPAPCSISSPMITRTVFALQNFKSLVILWFIDAFRFFFFASPWSHLECVMIDHLSRTWPLATKTNLSRLSMKKKMCVHECI